MEHTEPDHTSFSDISRLKLSEEIRKGRNGVTVYKSNYNGDLVAVKRFLKDHIHIDDRIIRFLANHPHQNVVLPRKVLYHGEYGFVIQELCLCNLQDLIRAFRARGRASNFAVSFDDASCVVEVEQERKLSSLRDSIQDVDLSSDTFLKLTKDIVLGLEFLHCNGIIHGNLKPDNIMIVLTQDGKNLVAKVADPGVSTSLQGSRFLPRQYWARLGWQAPELLHSSKSPTLYSDMFSLGCLLYTCLIPGRHPFGRIVNTDSGVHIIMRTG